MQFPILRLTRGVGNEQWTLDINGELLTLVAPDGAILLQWTPQQAAQGITFPSFSKSIKYPSFTVPQLGVFQFNMHPQPLQQLRIFANRGIVAGGPAAMRSVLITAVLTTVGGFLMMCFGALALIFTLIEFNNGKKEAASHPIGFVTGLIGFAVLCRGIYGFYHYFSLKKLGATQANMPPVIQPPPVR